RSRLLQDRYMRIEMRIRNIVGDVDPNHPGEIAQSFLQALEQVAPELIVFPKNNDLAVGIERLNVVRVDTSLRAERWLPAHHPVKCLRITPLLVPGRNEELRYLPLVEKLPHGKIAGRSEGAEHQQYVIPLDQPVRQIERGGWIGMIVVGNEPHLAAINSAVVVDHVEVSGFGLADRAKSSQF